MPYTIPSYTVSPGAVYQPKGAGLILDQISGAIAAWSTRRLISTAPADIARGRDASTNEEDFTAAELAGSGFTDLAGAGDGFYVTLYDQIGSNNATQATAASQPKGVDTGSLITDGAVPVLDFDGANALRVTDSPTFDWTTQLSGGGWIKNNKSNLTTTECIFGKYDGPLNQREFTFVVDGNEKLLLVLGIAGGTSATTQTSNNSIVTNSWNHVFFTYDAGTVTLYLNGSLLLSTESSTHVSSINNEAVDLIIGSNLTNNSLINQWDGQLNDVIIFNRALSSSEVSQLYTALS